MLQEKATNQEAELKNPDLEIYNPAFAAEICSWVPDNKTFQLISGDIGKKLTENTLQQWVDNSKSAYLLMLSSEPLAFATLSTNEYKLPTGYCEICHCIVSPCQRRKGYGSAIVGRLTEVAKKDFQYVIGRVNRSNIFSIEMLKKLEWFPTHELWCDQTFLWFAKRTS